MDKIAALVSQCQSAIKPNHTYVYGSSAGGYAALSLARIKTNLRVISINPQIYLRNWSNGAVNLFAQSAFSLPREDFLAKYPALDDVSAGLDLSANGNLILICQNLTDSWLEGQVGLLQSKKPRLFDSPNWRYETFNRPENHAAERYEWVPQIFAAFDRWLDQTPESHLIGTKEYSTQQF